MKTILLVMVLATLVACTSSTETVRAVESLGLTEVKPTGYRFWGCGEDDSFHTGFEATNPQGKVVTGTVCSGWFKGATVRFD